MAESYITYIDESGCDGFRFGRGSSNWFVLAGAVFRSTNEPEVVKVVDAVRIELKRDPARDLHFRDLKHQQRLLLTDRIGKAKVRCVVVAIHKPSITDTGTYQTKNLLYHYASRLLIERVSWLCTALREHADPNDGTTKIIFSHRRTTPHTGIQDYLRKLQTKPTEIDWSAINVDNVGAHPHKHRKALWFADCLASSFWYGLEPSSVGFTEGRYAQHMRKVVWNSKGAYAGSGIKIYPREALSALDLKDKHAWLKATYGISQK